MYIRFRAKALQIQHHVTELQGTGVCLTDSHSLLRLSDFGLLTSHFIMICTGHESSMAPDKKKNESVVASSPPTGKRCQKS